jgi:TPP-dependent pyruvate/acetoin dehydrogenase alpha subunit
MNNCLLGRNAGYCFAMGENYMDPDFHNMEIKVAALEHDIYSARLMPARRRDIHIMNGQTMHSSPEKNAGQAGTRPAQPGSESLLRMLEHLVLVREFELKCEAMWKAKEPLVGEYHLSLGQEAIAVGTCAAIEPDDFICPSIRGMGVYLCRGTPLQYLMATFFDRQGGIGAGRWAHWHSPVPEAGILAQTGMLGSGLVTSNGVALTQQYLETGKVVVAMLGDGATNTGYFHEGMNFAAFRLLPIVIIIENNRMAVSTPLHTVMRAENLSSRAAGYGIPGVTVDGNDVLAVNDTVRQAVARARKGDGPTLIECVTYRWGGSTVRDPDLLRPAAEKEAARKNCPLARLKGRLVEQGILAEADFDAMTRTVRQRIDAAEQHAKKMPLLEAGGDLLSKYEPYAQGVRS